MDFTSLWAAFCVRQGIPFEGFSVGMDIAIDDLEAWSDRGFPSLWRAIDDRQERERVSSEDRKEGWRGQGKTQGAFPRTLRAHGRR